VTLQKRGVRNQRDRFEISAPGDQPSAGEEAKLTRFRADATKSGLLSAMISQRPVYEAGGGQPETGESRFALLKSQGMQKTIADFTGVWRGLEVQVRPRLKLEHIWH